MQGESGSNEGRERLLEADSGLGDADFDDSLLQAVSRAAPPPFRMPVPGELLGGKSGQRFKLLSPLGGGAMGYVFRAWDEELHRMVALKFLLARKADEHMIALLHQEARAVAQLDHENIVRLFDVSEWTPPHSQAGLPFLVMECLEGEALSSLLRRERPELARALHLVDEVVSGLAHAHAQHVIHRDLKPSNVFLTAEGRVKLLDFGLAHLLPTALSPGLLLMMTAGTPAYMAPEQWRGEEQDERTDLWAVGMLLYELLTGELPFAQACPEQLRARVTSSEPMPPVRERRPELPWKVSVLVDTLLAKAPAQRFQTAQELAQELRELEEHLGFRRPVSPSLLCQRRQLTLLACTLADLAELAEHLDAEDLGDLQALFHQACAAIIQQQGGYLTLSVGNEVLACFGYPRAQEADAEHAVRAGLLLVQRLPEALRTRLAPGRASVLAVKVGVHTDVVNVEANAQGVEGQKLAFRGEAPQVVTWLAREAGPGEVWLSGTTWRLVQGACETESLGPRTFPGLVGAQRQEAYRVLPEWRTLSRFERTRLARGLTPLVGRERELRELMAHWARARSGQGGVVLVSGEPGIGKSRLIRELGERVAAEGGPWLRGQCWAELSASPLHPFIELLQRQLPERPPELRWRVLLERLGELGLSSESIHLLATLLPPMPPASPLLPLSPQRRKEMTFEALVALLLQLAARRPVLAVVEDLHWADPSTLELLGRVLGRLEGARVLLLLSARPEFSSPWSSRPDLHRLELKRLSVEHITLLMRQCGGQALPQEVMARMAARTDGIPLFAEELTRLVLGQASPSGAPPAGHAIPPTLQELLLARLDRLPGRLRTLAQLGAVVGRTFSQALLEQLTGRGETALRRDLESLVAVDLLQPAEESTGPGYQFRHALLQEAAYQSLPRGTRRKHHRHIAQVLVERFPEVVQTRPEVLAHHYTEADEVEPAIDAWARAGELASQRMANVEAIHHLTRALELLRRLPDSPQRSGQELRLLLALSAPLVQLQGFGSREAERTYARAQELLRTRHEALAGFELPYWVHAYYSARARYSQALEVAEHTVALGRRRGEPELLAQGCWMMAFVFYVRGQLRAAQDYAWRAEACTDFELARHRAVATRQWINPRVVALAYSAVFQSELDQVEEAGGYSQRALELAWRIGHPHTTVFALLQVSMGCHFREEAQSALRWTREAGRLADEYGFRVWRAWAAPFQSWALAALGQPQEALTLMREGSEYLRAVGILAYRFHYNLGILADIHLRLGQPGQALAVLTEALRALDTGGEHFYEAELYRLRGEALRGLGREADARDSFLGALRVARAQGARAFERKAAQALGLDASFTPSCPAHV